MKFQAIEWWPVYAPVAFGIDLPLSDEEKREFEASFASFEFWQARIGVLYDAAEEKRRKAGERAKDVAFVQRQRPWWSQARCEALVDSRRRKMRPLRRVVPA